MTILLFSLVILAVGIWGAVVGALAAATRSPAVTPASPTYDLRSEQPAIVAFLAGGFAAEKVTVTAAPATLLDLGARGIVGIEHIGPELSLVRLRRGAKTAELTPYERLVYDRITALATADGVVATGALAEGTREIDSWRKKFATSLRSEARRSGLSEARWHRRHHTVFAVVSGLPALAVGTVLAAWEHATAAGDSDPIGAFAGGAVVTYAVLMFLAERLNNERATPAGAAAAGHWLGVRAQYSTLAFDDKPAAAVSIWGREFAYAAALGLADRAVMSLPVAMPADCGQAWSDYGGMWHRVTVLYRGKGMGRIIWGRRPQDAALAVTVSAIVAIPPVLITLAVLSAFTGFPGDPVNVALLTGGLIALSGFGLIVGDATTSTTSRGQVVRLRRRVVKQSGNSTKYRYWVAIDDGSAPTVRALGTTAETWGSLHEGDLVEVQVGRWLGWCGNITVLNPSRHRGQL